MSIYSLLNEIYTNPEITVSQCKEMAKAGIDYLEQQQIDMENLTKGWDSDKKRMDAEYIKGVMVNMEKHASDIIEFSIGDDMSLKKMIEHYCMNTGFDDMPILSDQQCHELSNKYGLSYSEIRSEFSKELISAPY